MRRDARARTGGGGGGGGEGKEIGRADNAGPISRSRSLHFDRQHSSIPHALALQQPRSLHFWMIPFRLSLIPWLALLFSVVCKICVHVYNVFIFLLSATAVYRGVGNFQLCIDCTLGLCRVRTGCSREGFTAITKVVQPFNVGIQLRVTLYIMRRMVSYTRGREGGREGE